MRRGRLAHGARKIADSWRRLAPRTRRLLTIGVPLCLSGFFGVLAGVGAGALIQMPKVDSIADFQPALITQLFDADGERFATFARERRILLTDEELPELVRQAVLASEDSNFFEHGGVDPIGVLRAVVKNVVEGRRGGSVVGGSTITQQLARRLFLTPGKTWRRKIEEALLAVELEKNFSKDQILTLYCNLMYFNHGNYGIEAAARSYFDVPAADVHGCSERVTPGKGGRRVCPVILSQEERLDGDTTFAEAKPRTPGVAALAGVVRYALRCSLRTKGEPGSAHRFLAAVLGVVHPGNRLGLDCRTRFPCRDSAGLPGI